MYRLLFAGTLFLTCIGQVLPQIEIDPCRKISGDAERLRCYDEVAAQLPSTSPATANSIWADRYLKDAERETFTLTMRKPNYFLITHVTDPNRAPYEFLGQDAELDQNEIKFQVSFQSKLADNMFGRNGDLWFGYTQASFWQLFNSEISAPFRETNYEPELYLSFLTDYPMFGLTGRIVNFGFVHQSNGRAEPLSRSWNRVYAELFFERGDFALAIKPWARIKESADKDDNPDITDYLGHYELRAYYHLRKHLLSATLRNLFDDEHRYNAELQWSFPIKGRLRGLVQWYNGYGENLIDYDHDNHRIGIGVLMTDWL